MQTYLFYDIETTGLSKPFDQVLQFAAIRTDENLQELERHEFRIRLSDGVIPSPGALLTHRMGIHDIQQGVSEFGAITAIHRIMNTPGTLSLGYNTLGFDDEFLRFSFYRNLLSPYTHQFANRCGRMDIYPVTLMYYLFKNTALKWPVTDGKLSLKLENLNAANHFFEGQAHDAMTDVLVTLALAKRLREDESMWRYQHGYFQKNSDLARMQPLKKDIALMIRTRLGTADAFQCPVLYLGDHRHYKNQQLWLRLDSGSLTETTPENIAETTFILKKKPGEPDFVLPFSGRFLSHLSEERKTRTFSNHLWLQENPALLNAIREYHADFRWPENPRTDCEARLYVDGFFTSEEVRFNAEFHAAAPCDKIQLAENAPSETVRQLAARIIARNFAPLMTPEITKRYDSFIGNLLSERADAVPTDHQGNARLTPKAALRIISELQTDPKTAPEDLKILDDYAQWLSGLTPHLQTAGAD